MNTAVNSGNAYHVQGGLPLNFEMTDLLEWRIIARLPRIQFEGAVCHITSRGNARQEILQDVTHKLERDAHIHEVVHLNDYKLQEIWDYVGLHFSMISAIAKKQAVGSLK